MKSEDWSDPSNYSIEMNKKFGYISIEGKGKYSSYFWSRASNPRAYPTYEAEAADMWAELIGEDDE